VLNFTPTSIDKSTLKARLQPAGWLQSRVAAVRCHRFWKWQPHN